MERVCRNHPDHGQLSGVCPICLRERLAELQSVYPIKSSAMATSLDFSSPFYLPGSSSLADRHRHRWIWSVSTVDLFGNSLRKSSSARFNGGDEGFGEQRKKQSGFWRRLIQIKRMKKENFLHSTNPGKIAVRA